MNSLIWIIAIVVLQAVVAGIAKKADAKAKAARAASAARAAGGAPDAASAAGARSATVVRVRQATGAPQRAVARPVNPAQSVRPASSAATPGASAPQPPEPPPLVTRAAGRQAAPIERVFVVDQMRTDGAAPAARPPTPPRQALTVAIPEAELDDELAALRSRQRLAEAVDKVRALQAKVAEGLPGVSTERPTIDGGSHGLRRPAVDVSALRAAIRNPADIRKALILGEVLGAPRGVRIA